MKGIVTKSTGSWYHLLTEEGKEYLARMRGKFRIANIKHTNPIAVGDEVDFEVDKDEIAVITHIHERKNYIIRKSVNLSKKTHIIASNIDLAFLMITLSNPKTSLGFIDRFLVTAEAYHIPVILLFNKIDAYTEEDLQELERYKSIYQPIGYESFSISAETEVGLEEVKNRMKDSVSMVSGHSGVGKSTLLNTLDPTLDLKTHQVSDFNSKGQHTTTFAQMYPWPFGGFIIDTPGIKEFGLVHFEKKELQNYFPEFYKFRDDCKFDNCIHVNEPKCGVREAVEKGEIAKSRYENYLTFLQDDIYTE
ncbi:MULTISPECIES: ribosome small subunit-dependent GTPase A [Weeksella]|uniref:ribosome small subunit-dependent GTPase A n=1 Tax=Weeksella TaxID=1013 RepID=UPI0008A2CCC9|nr:MULTISPECIES: ribosome small subunit-dependent GTPase A [Weeksella]MDK7375907.1 ribosome small subunit-dependent GTPase A [Weeksella virosa]OFM83813.1 ribosome small subunit-dependent GTPase A [Weeksella sp. HMSC059D05]